MNKLVIAPKNTDIKCFIDKGIDKYIFGLNNYSVNYDALVTVEEVLDLKDKYNIDIFLAINKNLNNSDLDYIKEVLIKLNNTGIEVLFYDLMILSLKNELDLNIDLVWNQTHMVTNYNTCNYYYNENVKYAYLSSEITLEEMIEIRNKSNIIPLVFVFGKSIMAFSKRKLLTNYFSSINKSKDKDSYLIKENISNNNYLVKESLLGTAILNDNILNGIKPMKSLNDNNFNYFIMSEDVDHELFLKVIECYNYVLNNDVEDDYYEMVYDLVSSNNMGFFYNKTIFKVKKDEK